MGSGKFKYFGKKNSYLQSFCIYTFYIATNGTTMLIDSAFILSVNRFNKLMVLCLMIRSLTDIQLK